MNTSELITALLHGELTDDRSVAELMHVLSVSPEKRATFIDHVKLSRQMLRSGRSIAPAPAAAQGVWNQIAALEPALGIAPSSVGAIAAQPSVERKTDWRRVGLFLIFLLIGLGGGYLSGYLSGSTAEISYLPDQRVADHTSIAANAAGTISDPLPGNDVSLGIIDAVPGTSSAEEKENRGKTSGSNQRIAELNGMLARERQTNAALLTTIAELRSTLQELQERSAPKLEGAANSESVADLPSSTLYTARPFSTPLITPEDAHNAISEPTTTATVSSSRLLQPAIVNTNAPSPWRIEMRQYLRSSLPSVQGLESAGNILSDREIGAGLEFTALHRPMRLGVAVGGTTFAQVYHTNTGGELFDTIIEQAPQLTYGRAWIAPSIFEGERIGASLEFGVGGTKLGPIGTAGLDLEYKAAQRVTIHAGVSSWLLWTSFRGQLQTSTNLNAHIGVSLNP